MSQSTAEHRTVIAAAALFGAAALLSQRRIDWDLYGHLTFGHAALQAGHVLTHDPYSFTAAGAPWFNHEWLWEVASWLLYAGGGDRALLLAKALSGAVALGSLAALGLRRSANPNVLLGVLAVVAVALGPDVYVRPYTVTYACFPLCLYLLDRVEEGWWPGAALCGLFLLWANAHAAFVVGLGTVVIYAAVAALQRRPVWRRLSGIALLSSALVCVSPYGPSYWGFVLRAVTMHRTYITEYRAVPWDLPPTADPFFWYKVLLLVTVAAAVRRRPPLEGLLLLVITATMSLDAYRHVPLFVLACGAYLPGLLPGPWAYRPGRVGVGLGLVGCCLMAAPGLHLQVPTRPGTGDFLPFDAIRFIKANGLHGNIAVHFDWGEFLIWELPDSKVSFDGRLETVYPPAVVQRNLDFLLDGDAAYATDIGADMVLIPFDPARPGALFKALYADRGHWLPVFGGSGTALFVRAGQAHGPWVMPPQEIDPPVVPLTGPPSVGPGPAHGE